MCEKHGCCGCVAEERDRLRESLVETEARGEMLERTLRGTRQVRDEYQDMYGCQAILDDEQKTDRCRMEEAGRGKCRAHLMDALARSEERVRDLDAATIALQAEVDEVWEDHDAEVQVNLRLRDALDKMLAIAQGIRVREVQAMEEAGTWEKYLNQSMQEWGELNRVHREAVGESLSRAVREAQARQSEAEAMADMIRVVEKEHEAIALLLHVEEWLEARRRRDAATAILERIEKEGAQDG